MASRKSRKRSPPTTKRKLDTWPLYILVLALFALYVHYQSVPLAAMVFGVVLFFAISIVVALEIINGVKEEGYIRNFVEIAVAIIIIGVLWFALRALLGTSYPLDVVPSCSMLPSLKRGDMVLLQGVSSVVALKAPIVEVPSAQFSSMKANLSSVEFACVAYNETPSGIKVSQVMKPGYKLGLYEEGASPGRIVPGGYQRGLISYTCGTVQVLLQNGTVINEAYTTSVNIAGTTVREDLNNSIVVYKTIPPDLFYRQGDAYVIHRVYAVLNVSGSYYALTKGDNNPGLDIQYQNYPAGMSEIEGRVIASVPLLGYVKLVLSNNFNQPEGCNSTVLQ